MRESWEPLIYSWWVRSTGDNRTCNWCEVGWGQSCGTEPLTSGIWCYLQVDSVRIELNCRTCSWCCRLLGEGKPPTSAVRSSGSVVVLWELRRHTGGELGFSPLKMTKGLSECQERRTNDWKSKNMGKYNRLFFFL